MSRWLGWVAEYPDEGCVQVEASSVDEAVTEAARVLKEPPTRVSVSRET